MSTTLPEVQTRFSAIDNNEQQQWVEIPHPIWASWVESQFATTGTPDFSDKRMQEIMTSYIFNNPDMSVQNLEKSITEALILVQSTSKNAVKTLTAPWREHNQGLLCSYDMEKDDKTHASLTIHERLKRQEANLYNPKMIISTGERNSTWYAPIDEAKSDITSYMGSEPEMTKDSGWSWQKGKLTLIEGSALRQIPGDCDRKTGLEHPGGKKTWEAALRLERSLEDFESVVVHNCTGCTLLAAASEEVKSKIRAVTQTCGYFFTKATDTKRGVIKVAGNYNFHGSAYEATLAFCNENQIPFIVAHPSVLASFKTSKLSDCPGYSKVINAKVEDPGPVRDIITHALRWSYRWLNQIAADVTQTYGMPKVKQNMEDIASWMPQSGLGSRPEFLDEADQLWCVEPENCKFSRDRRVRVFPKAFDFGEDNTFGDVITAITDGPQPLCRIYQPVTFDLTSKEPLTCYTIDPASYNYMALAVDEDVLLRQCGEHLEYSINRDAARAEASGRPTYAKINTQVALESRLFAQLGELQIHRILESGNLKGADDEAAVRAACEEALSYIAKGTMTKIAAEILGDTEPSQRDVM